MTLIYFFSTIVIIMMLMWIGFRWLVKHQFEMFTRIADDPEFRAARLSQLSLQIQNDPTNPKYRFARANIRWLENDFSGIVEDLVVYLQSKQQHDAAWDDLAIALLALEKPADALEAARTARRISPNYAGFRATEVRALLEAGELPLAEEALRSWELEDEKWRAMPAGSAIRGRTVGKSKSKDPALSLYQAAWKMMTNNEHEAKIYLDEALKLRPDLVEAIPLAKCLHSLQHLITEETNDDPVADQPRLKITLEKIKLDVEYEGRNE